MDLKLEFKKEVLAFPLATFKTLDSHVKSLLAFSYESTELVENYAVEKREGICSRVMEMIRRFKRKVTSIYKDREVYHPYNEEYNRAAKKPAR